MSNYKLKIKNLEHSNAGLFEKVCLKVTGVVAVDTWRGRSELKISESFDPGKLHDALMAAGFEVEDLDKETDVAIEGMTCRSCELFIERRLRKLPGVAAVRADATRGVAHLSMKDGAPALGRIAEALRDSKYSVPGYGAPLHQPRLLEVGAAFVAAGVALYLLGRVDLAETFGLKAGAGLGFVSAALLGLVAGSTSCVAVSGGLLLSVTAKYRARNTDGNQAFPVGAFIAGRVISYSMFGAFIGAIGSALTPTPFVTGAITVVAALVMFAAGLDMLGLAPGWLKVVVPHMPKSIAHRIFDADESGAYAMPALFGAATFFIPCGFTQALQIYALTAGGAMAGGLLLGGFALGTAPALAALGWASTALKGRTGERFFRFTGAIVVLLGLFNLKNGLVAAGFNPSLSAFLPTAAPAPSYGGVPVENGVQQLKIRLISSEPYYSPSDRLTVKAGIPVRLEVDGAGYGCRTIFQIPSLGVKLPLTEDVNVVEFTPDKPGTATFSCSMGMYPGTLVIEPAS